MYKYFATCPKGLEGLLQDELAALGALDVTQTVSGVNFNGDELIGIKACLWSRFATRILLKLVTFHADSELELYNGAYNIRYDEYFDVKSTIKVSFNGQNDFIRNTTYGALKIKDAICDKFVKLYDDRPNVDKKNPDVRINVHLDKKNDVTISLDLSGDALFRRDYRESQGIAPLKENLAQAIVTRTGYTSGNVVDPMCGSGTLLIEAAMRAANIAPGIYRHKFGFLKLKSFKYSDYLSEKEKAQNIANEGIARLKAAKLEFVGFDNDEEVIKKALENVERAGLKDVITIKCQDLNDLYNPISEGKSKGYVICNPPYGERLGNFAQLLKVYTTLGLRVKENFKGYRVGIISSNEELLGCLRLRPLKTYKLFNGALNCQLRVFEINENLTEEALNKAKLNSNNISNNDASLSENSTTPKTLKDKDGVPQEVNTNISANADSNSNLEAQGKNLENPKENNLSECKAQSSTSSSNASEKAKPLVAVDFANRLAKNIKHLDKWAKKEGIEAYRIYDADLPNYCAAIDRYQDYIVINEYKAPKTIKDYVAKERLLDMIQALVEVTGVDGDKVIVKVRERKKGETQYEKLSDCKHTLLIKEYNASFIVNLWDYLDTGLFLDHRLTRKLIMEESMGKDFLNVFAYTGSATVYAALGGAKTTTTVDMSRTYLNWAKDNLKANNIPPANHFFVQEDCLEWLKSANGNYDLIFCDPPTFSNSKRMTDVFDVQRDHVALINNLARLLRDDGKIIFSNNNRNFIMNEEGLTKANLKAKNITAKTIPLDFKRNSKIHNCWEITKVKD